jgi:hypothetical protein
MNDLIPVALKSGPEIAFFFWLFSPFGPGRKGGMGREKSFLPLLNFFSDYHAFIITRLIFV